MLMARFSQETGCSSYKIDPTTAGFSHTFVFVCHKHGCFKFRVRETIFPLFCIFVFYEFITLLPCPNLYLNLSWRN